MLESISKTILQNGSSESVTTNTLTGLDWQRSLSQHLWYLGSPLASVPDTLAMYEQAWRQQPYCARPQPK